MLQEGKKKKQELAHAPEPQLALATNSLALRLQLLWGSYRRKIMGFKIQELKNTLM